MIVLKCLLLLLFMLSSSALAQHDSLWSRTYGGSGHDYCTAAVQTLDGGYLTAGYRNAMGQSDDFWIVKADANGDSVWSQTYRNGSLEQCHAAQPIADGGFILAGSTGPFGVYDWWLVRTNANGDSLWSRSYGGSGNDVCHSVQQTADGGYILAGFAVSSGDGSGLPDGWLLKTNANGDSIWSRSFGGSNWDAFNCVRQTPEGGYVMTGHTSSFGVSAGEVWLVRTDADGNQLWSQTFSAGNIDAGRVVVPTADGGFAVAGYTHRGPALGYNYWLVKTNANGDSLWSRHFGGSDAEYCQSLLQTADGGYALAGYTQSFGAGGTDLWLVRTSAAGDSVWSRTLGRSSAEYGGFLLPTPDGSFALAGATTVNGPSNTDHWLVKLFSTELPELTTVADVGNDQGRRVRLRWNRSGYDRANPRHSILGYSIYRRIDQYLNSTARPANFGALDWPPGDWEFVATVPAFGETTYAAVAPALADSNSAGIYWSTFFVRAATPNPLIFFDSAVDSGYSWDNLAPDAALVTAEIDPTGTSLTLRWGAVSTGGGGQPEQNGIWYRVYGHSHLDFVPDTGNLIGTTQQTYLSVPVTQRGLYFKVLVSDDH